MRGDPLYDKFESPRKPTPAEEHQANVEMLLTSVVIQQARTYDVMLALLLEQNSDAAKELRDMHEAGQLWCPPPSFELDDDNEE